MIITGFSAQVIISFLKFGQIFIEKIAQVLLVKLQHHGFRLCYKWLSLKLQVQLLFIIVSGGLDRFQFFFLKHYNLDNDYVLKWKLHHQTRKFRKFFEVLLTPGY